MIDVQNGFLAPADLKALLGDITVHGVYKILKTNKIEVLKTKTKRTRIPPKGVRQLLENKGFVYPTSNISFQIVKGGVGKTSLSYALGLRASHYGAKVLLIDLDQQGNLSRSFNLQAREHAVWLDIIKDSLPINQAIIKLTNELHILPSNLNNSRLDLELTQGNPNLKDIIKDKLGPIRDQYDIVIFDCPPAINKINVSATCASDTVIIPLTPDPYAMDGLDFTLAELKRIKTNFKLNFDHKIIWNRYDGRERLGTFYMHEVAKDSKKVNHVLPVVIRVDTSLKNSIFDATSLFEQQRKSAIRDDIDQFAKEILGINSWLEEKEKEKQREYRVI